MTTLSPQQGEAVQLIRSRLAGDYPEPLTYLAGYAGTGKSTILPFIIDDLGIDPASVRFMAPTGKAAKVMRSKLRAQKFANSATSTIHSAIYRAKPAPIGQLEAELYEHMDRREKLRNLGREYHAHEIEVLTKQIARLERELENAYSEDKISFQLNVDSPLQEAKLVVVDEGSMVGKMVADDLMYFGVPILVMGDPGQLPPVEDVAGLTGGDPDYFLTEIHRQAADNPILQLATMARQGQRIKEGVYGDGRATVVRRSQFNEGFFDWRDDPPPQFICGMNKTRWSVTKLLRDGYLGKGRLG